MRSKKVVTAVICGAMALSVCGWTNISVKAEETDNVISESVQDDEATVEESEEFVETDENQEVEEQEVQAESELQEDLEEEEKIKTQGEFDESLDLEELNYLDEVEEFTLNILCLSKEVLKKRSVYYDGELFIYTLYEYDKNGNEIQYIDYYPDIP